MRKDKHCFNVDKLTLCYNVSLDSPLQNINNKLELNLLDFKLVKIDSKHFENAYNIYFLWNYDDNSDIMEWHLYGQLKFNLKIDKNDDEYVRRAWVYLDNRSLYTEFYEGVNIIKLIEILEIALDLEYNNISSFDIALDSTVNITARVKRMIRNKKVITHLNTKEIKNRKIVQRDIKYLNVGNLDNYTSTSLYIHQKDSEGFGMNLYNKSNEINEKSNKQYIKIWDNMTNKQTIYRAEVRLKNKHIKKYLNDNNITFSHDLFNNQKFLSDCFKDFSERLIKFEYKNKYYNVIDLLSTIPISKEG